MDFTTKGLQPGFLSVPKPFKCCMSYFPELTPSFAFFSVLIIAITPRSGKHERLFREEWAHAQREGVQFERSHLERLVPQ